MNTNPAIKPLRVLSLGWGIQSFTLACMAALKEIEPIDYAIHADTKFERKSTYELAAKFTPWLEERGVKVHTVQGSHNDVIMAEWSNSVMIPAFTKDAEGNRGRLRRQCTHDWKVMPVRRHIRRLRTHGQKCEMLLGISADEAQRMKDSDVNFVQHVYPLIDMHITRQGCIDWLNAHSLPIPDKSACVFCPYHNKAQWQDLRDKGGEDWQTAVAVDDAIRDKRGGAGYPLFVHPKRIPLAQAIPANETVPDSGTYEDDGCDTGNCFV